MLLYELVLVVLVFQLLVNKQGARFIHYQENQSTVLIEAVVQIRCIYSSANLVAVDDFQIEYYGRERSDNFSGCYTTCLLVRKRITGGEILLWRPMHMGIEVKQVALRR